MSVNFSVFSAVISSQIRFLAKKHEILPNVNLCYPRKITERGKSKRNTPTGKDEICCKQKMKKNNAIKHISTSLRFRKPTEL